MTAKKIQKPQHGKKPPAAPTPPRAAMKPWVADLLACAAIFLAVFIMFNEIALRGKAFSRGDDTEAAASMNTFAVEEAQNGSYPMWCPYLFGGFPSLAAGAYSNYEYMGMPYALANRYLSPRYWADLVTVRGLFLAGPNPPSDSARWYLAIFLYGGLLTYLLLRRLGFNVWIGLLGGLIMALNPYLISLATAAHGGKMLTFIYMPLLILATWNVLEKRRLFDMAILALALGWQIGVGGHTQIIFYSFVLMGLLYAVWLVFELRQKVTVKALLPALYLIIATVLGFGAGAVWYIPLLKYLGYSIRGMAPAIAAAGTSSGYSLTDATMWSMAPRELITFIVPSWFGLKSPYYWGSMPFTSSSIYFGVVPLLFAVLAFFGKKDRLFWGLTAVSVFSILLSFGSHFQSFYAFFFNFLPFFSKFRTPSLILLLVMLAGIVFAAYGLRFVLTLENNAKWRKVFLRGAVVCVALLLIFLVAGEAFSGLFGSFTKTGEAQQYNPQQLAQLTKIRFGMLRTDLLLSLLFLSLAFGALWLKLTGRIKTTALLATVLVITLVDIWRFSTQFFEPQPASTVTETLRPNRIVETLRQDSSYFRVFPLGRLMQDNRWAAWRVPSLGGYHAAKMRSYQDLVDNLFSKSSDARVPLNIPLLSALNCKYFVAEGQLPPNLGFEPVTQDPQAKLFLYRNPRALDRVYFADSVLVIPDRAAALRKMQEPSFLFDYMAVVDRPLPGPVAYDARREVKITEYRPHVVRISARVAQAALLVLSDAHYPPGWEALDNGSSTPIYQVNGFVRGLYVRPGQHTIEFRYQGKYEQRGVMVATLSHFVAWGLVIGTYLYGRRRRKAAA
ncbi:MAG: hypothetical protein NT025_01585 [bacterium]|nr:hypothetical protein [bacterium]